tara:strand:+ start:194 stop:574 length:381 start_codon:yes stop_codon:yes gene_type:complete
LTKKSKHIFDILEDTPALREVNGGWGTFTIKVIKGLKSGKQNCWGTCDFDTYEIHIEKKMEDGPARETILHEICHMLLELCGMGGDGEGENEEFIWASNEKLTITMSRAFLLFTRLNPELAKELLL